MQTTFEKEDVRQKEIIACTQRCIFEIINNSSPPTRAGGSPHGARGAERIASLNVGVGVMVQEARTTLRPADGFGRSRRRGRSARVRDRHPAASIVVPLVIGVVLGVPDRLPQRRPAPFLPVLAQRRVELADGAPLRAREVLFEDGVRLGDRSRRRGSWSGRGRRTRLRCIR